MTDNIAGVGGDGNCIGTEGTCEANLDPFLSR